MLLDIFYSSYMFFVIAPFCFVAIWYYSYAIYSGRLFSQEMKVFKDLGFYPPVSIIKPLCGLDCGTYQNLASFCQQVYPKYQIIFGVRDPLDPCVAVVRQLINNFPEVDIEIVISDISIGTNQKVNNLANAVVEAKYSILVLADSDVRVGSSYLKKIIQPMSDPTVGAVTCLYRPLAQGWIANFEAVGISTDYLASVIVAHQLEGIRFALGPTVVVRRSTFESLGGFCAIANFLADDFQIGFLFAQANYKVVLSEYVIDHLITSESWKDLIQRQVRWNLCTRVSRPWGYLGLLFTQGTITSLGLVIATSGAWQAWSLLAIVWTLRLWMAWTVGVIILNEPVAKRAIWLVPLRDLISFLIWCYGLFVNQIEWRGKIYRLAKGGKLVLKQIGEESQPVLPAILSQSK